MGVRMHGKSLAHAAAMGYRRMRHFFARGEMIGVAVLAVIGVTLLALAPKKSPVTWAALPGDGEATTWMRVAN
ncbi:MAG: hypothetical protein WA626_12845 [Acidobacteriaceae bacterium]